MKLLIHSQLSLWTLIVLFSAATLHAEESSVLTPLTEAQKKQQEEGEALARKIMSKMPRFSIVGTIEQNGGNSYFVNGEAIKINDKTRIEGDLRVGSVATITGFVENGVRVARVVRVADALVDTGALTNSPPSPESARLDVQSSPSKN